MSVRLGLEQRPACNRDSRAGATKTASHARAPRLCARVKGQAQCRPRCACEYFRPFLQPRYQISNGIIVFFFLLKITAMRKELHSSRKAAHGSAAAHPPPSIPAAVIELEMDFNRPFVSFLFTLHPLPFTLHPSGIGHDPGIRHACFRACVRVYVFSARVHARA